MIYSLTAEKNVEEHKDEDLEINIQSARKAGDLLPRQIADLKGGYKRIKAGYSLLPLQVKTRRGKGKKDNTNQYQKHIILEY